MENEKIIYNIPAAHLLIETELLIERKRIYRMQHFHPEAELINVISGKICVDTAQGNYTVNPGETAFICGGTLHQIIPKAEQSKCIMLQTGIRSDTGYKLNYLSMLPNFKGCYIFEADSEFSKLVTETAREAKEHLPEYERCIEANIVKISVILLRQGIILNQEYMQAPSGSNRLMPAIEYIHSHFREEIMLSKAAKTVNLDPCYFSRLFKSLFGITMTDYVNNLRLCAAEQLIYEGSSVTSAAYQSGFFSTQYFNRLFKKRYGCTPSVYKKMLFYHPKDNNKTV